MSYPTNNQGMIANYLPVSEFQPGHTEFACGAFATTSNAWAAPYNQLARTDAQNLINWAEAEYTKAAGDNGPTNTNGAAYKPGPWFLVGIVVCCIPLFKGFLSLPTFCY